jgi:asparagine synthase (glutamine-hydrolysing)
MCGICGIYAFGGHADREQVLRMMSAMRHRGPDGEGCFVSGEIGLGHRRLSIIDLTGGAQPITNEDGSLYVIFNGEIYNFIELREELLRHDHIFATKSDTEVILHAYEQWGKDCVSRFNGIFAFALWDANRKQLFLARDHLGVKPLYWTHLGNRFLFASEIKSLLTETECPREVDLHALSQLFTLRSVPSPRTLFRGIQKLAPGHWMVVTHDGVRTERYWTWKPRIRNNASVADATTEYQELLEDAVRLQMRSDVPVGLFLSSGVDSSALLALMCQFSSNPVQTFTIGFEDGEGSNETDDAREFAARYGADHHEFRVTADDYEAYSHRYLNDLEEPVAHESAAAFYFVSKIASSKVKVALSGQGADEPWAGYRRYVGVNLSSLYSRLPRVLARNVIRPLVLGYSQDEALRRGVESLDEPDLLARFIKIYSFFSASMKKQLFQPWVKAQVSPKGVEARTALSVLHRDVASLDPLSQMLYLDTRTSLPDDLLMVGDKTAMANSLEARVPYLDYRLVEFVESLPANWKLRHFEGKYLHKRALQKWLPKELIYRKKKGFSNPLAKWLRTRMRDYTRECLLSPDSGVARYFDVAYIRSLLDLHDAGQVSLVRQIHLLLQFELWHRQFIDRRDFAHIDNSHYSTAHL